MSELDLGQVIESVVAEMVGLPRPGLRFRVDRVEATGDPATSMKVWATLHFLPAGSPFCCGEPGCHLGLFGESLAELGDRLGQFLGLGHSVAIEIVGQIAVQYHPGVEFSFETRAYRREP